MSHVSPLATFRVVVLVASKDRLALLATRSLPSIASQQRRCDELILVDDSPDKSSVDQIRKTAKGFGLPVSILRNRRTQGAAGAWNTGLDHLARSTADPRTTYVAILDDDDCWLPFHLTHCCDAAARGATLIASGFTRAVTGLPDEEIMPPTNLDVGSFYVGNPGVQPSSMMVRLDRLLEAGLFDEALPSCTDRDLLIRILRISEFDYCSTGVNTVRHFACSDRDRLSTPGSPQRLAGLSAFFTKHSSHMTAEQRLAAESRAVQLFGWSASAAATPSVLALTSSAIAQPAENVPSEIHLVVGLITDQKRLRALEGLMEDLLGLQNTPGLVGLDVLILENAVTDEAFTHELETAADSWRTQGLRVHVITQEARLLAMQAGELPPTTPGRLSIGPARTALQTYLYHFIKSRQGAVAWILDDDMRLDPLVSTAGTHKRQRMPLIPFLARLREDGVDIAIGQYTGAAPLPALSTLRVQMVDLLANLRWLALLPPDATLPDRSACNAASRAGRRDFYYDLSHKETDRIETPFWMEPAHETETVQSACERLCTQLDRILDGQQLFRPLVLEAVAAQAFERSTGLHRGGNTFVFNADALADVPNAVPDIGGRATRRSDMIWTLLQRTRHQRKIVSVPLGIYHARESQHGTAEEHERCLADDICGFALFSALQDHAADPLVDLGNRVVKLRSERLAAFRLAVHRIRGLAGELDTIAQAPGALAAHSIALATFARTVLTRIDKAMFARVADAVARLDAKQTVDFYNQLPGLIVQHQRCIASADLIHDQLRTQRVSNAVATVRRLTRDGVGCAARLRWLGHGAEGVALTDETSVFKVFDYWKPVASERARRRLGELVGRWSQGAGLYSISRFVTEGVDNVLIYPFEPSLPYNGGHGPGMVDLMADCYANHLICRNIHPKNLRVVDSAVKLIDYGGDLVFAHELDDFEWQFELMCRRAYLSWRFWHRPDLSELLRASLCDQDMPELSGFKDYFMQAVRQTTGQSAVQDPVLAMVSDLPRQRVLDFGCGKGELSRQLAEQGHNVVAYDPDPGLAKRLDVLASPSLKTATTFEQALTEGPFDLVVCRRVICLLDHAGTLDVAAQLRRAVKREGRVLVAVCHPGFAPWIATSEARPDAASSAHPDTSFRWIKRHRKSGRQLFEFHRPERVQRNMLQRAGFELIRRVERTTVDQFRFESTCDLLVFECRPADPPDCTLLIKACAMEADTVRAHVQRLVRQLSLPRPFHEVILALDTKEDAFLRQYTAGNLALLRTEATALQAQGWVDRVIEAPLEAEEHSRLNAKWLGRNDPATHAANGAQLSAIFAGFEACHTPYLLQADLDVLIGRSDSAHDYLHDMVQALTNDERAVTVAFNIAQTGDRTYSACGEAGPWRVETRFCLLHMHRLNAILPLMLPQSTPSRNLPAWHRALDASIQGGLAHSLRGGDRRTFFIHPKNDRKADTVGLFRIADVIGKGQVDPSQFGEVDLVGITEQWLRPSRFEPYVFIISGRNVEPGRFRRCLDSVLDQSRTDWGAVVFDDASHPAWSEMQQDLCSAHASRITFIRNPLRRGLLANTVEAIRMHCGRPDSVMITLDADDCLIGRKVLDILEAEYSNGADMTVGSMCRTDKKTYYPACFEQPREHRGGNVWQHLRSFRKSLFEAVPDHYLRLDGNYVEIASDWALMLPMAELAESPRWIREAVYLHEPGGARDPSTIQQRELIIAALIARAPLQRTRANSARLGDAA
jgi:2-polyprenyl-3-methyl-5-hydroxy-6-metoxy-1,4-benzoquinol methylase/glycosyltransferase involved in cell wall biosynthesis